MIIYQVISLPDAEITNALAALASVLINPEASKV
jgi:hypothetical protein